MELCSLLFSSEMALCSPAGHHPTSAGSQRAARERPLFTCTSLTHRTLCQRPLWMRQGLGSASRQSSPPKDGLIGGAAAPGAAPVEKTDLDMRAPEPLGPKHSPDCAGGASASLKVHNLWWWLFSPLSFHFGVGLEVKTYKQTKTKPHNKLHLGHEPT